MQDTPIVDMREAPVEMESNPGVRERVLSVFNLYHLPAGGSIRVVTVTHCRPRSRSPARMSGVASTQAGRHLPARSWPS